VGFYNDQTSDGQSLEGKAASRSLDSKGEIVRRGACRTGASDSLFKGVAVVRGKWEGGWSCAAPRQEREGGQAGDSGAARAGGDGHTTRGRGIERRGRC
jgi:hypothetical protein